MVCTREASLAERALEVLEVFLRGQRDFEADLCTNLRTALLQVLQRLSAENMGHGLGQGHTAQGKRLRTLLWPQNYKKSTLDMVLSYVLLKHRYSLDRLR